MPLLTRFTSYHDLISLGPEELAGVLLHEIHSAANASAQHPNMNAMGGVRRVEPPAVALSALLYPIENQDTPKWPSTMRVQVKMAALEAWGWLVSNGLIMRYPNDSSCYIPTRLGAELASEQAVANYRDQGILPIGLLHLRIMSDVRSHFLRGHYDTAVFHAFREVEMALREAIQGEPHWTGQEVAKRAFNPQTGELRDTSPDVTASEREAEFAIFSGAIGAYKNPASHRRSQVQRGDTARLVIFASHLLFRIEERNAAIAQR